MRPLAVTMLLARLAVACVGSVLADEPFRAQQPSADVAAALIAQAQGQEDE